MTDPLRLTTTDWSTAQTTNRMTTDKMPSVQDLLAACQEMEARKASLNVCVVSREVFDAMPFEYQELYLQFGNHVIEAPGKFAYEMPPTLRCVKESFIGVMYGAWGS